MNHQYLLCGDQLYVKFTGIRIKKTYIMKLNKIKHFYKKSENLSFLPIDYKLPPENVLFHWPFLNICIRSVLFYSVWFFDFRCLWSPRKKEQVTCVLPVMAEEQNTTQRP